ncbi:hypothetical protein [Bogoriella caseilytica]|uniref:Uncharacterized protein n=1 Tax=Bogoriella caseilytica TaxID=56055 RepID=A0A3N2BEH0_9MICO|nr:hypothetical protein [Bogoriella caseilytica]ROR73615.1 hypothetical protein EDD31_2002 [Bogoriella caseilytica]
MDMEQFWTGWTPITHSLVTVVAGYIALQVISSGQVGDASSIVPFVENNGDSGQQGRSTPNPA